MTPLELETQRSEVTKHAQVLARMMVMAGIAGDRECGASLFFAVTVLTRSVTLPDHELASLLAEIVEPSPAPPGVDACARCHRSADAHVAKRMNETCERYIAPRPKDV